MCIRDRLEAKSFIDVPAGKRMVLTAIAENEPILATKITGAGQRATLSAVLTPALTKGVM